MTTANKITVFRILLVPFFAVHLLYYFRNGEDINFWLACGAFFIAAVCDGVDGYVARRFNQRSELGAILDPLADKFLLVSALVLLTLDFEDRRGLAQVPLWLVGTVLGRDFILISGTVLIYYLHGKVQVCPHIISKVATVLQMICVGWVLLPMPAHWLTYWYIAAAAATAVSGLIYLAEGMRQLSASPASSPQPKPTDPPRGR